MVTPLKCEEGAACVPPVMVKPVILGVTGCAFCVTVIVWVVAPVAVMVMVSVRAEPDVLFDLGQNAN